MLRYLSTCGLLLSILQISGCSTRSVTIATEGEGIVSIVNWDSLESGGAVIGKTPQTITLEKIGDRVVKIDGPGKAPQFWVFSEMISDQLDVKVQLANIPGGGGSNVAGKSLDLNETHRLLLKAYRALAGGDLKVAKELSSKLSTIAPSVSAPLIISGLASMQEGDKDAARSAFTRAKSLDPQDSDIDKLLNAVQ
jgi:hypothetical protein